MASKKKVVLGKDELKRLMREQKNSSNSKNKRIDSPLASYNSQGVLSCVLCRCPLKTELLWPSHLQGRTHKQNVARLKEEQLRKEEAVVAMPPPAIKRKHSDTSSSPHNNKQQKTDKMKSNSVASQGSEDSKKNRTKPKGILKNAPSLGGLPSLSVADYSSSSDEEGEEAGRAPVVAPSGVQSSDSAAALPSDFFDAGVTPGTSTDTVKSPQVMSEKLPEGFFDDPKMDAKVRKVEYRDKFDEEWELFQRAMKDETHVSEVIMEEEDEVVTATRNIGEIDDQMRRWSHINELEKRKEQLMTQEIPQDGATKSPTYQPDNDDDNSDNDDDDDFEEFREWKSKKAL